MKSEHPSSGFSLPAALLRIAAGAGLSVAVIHAAAWLATPRGLGFNPHPWYLAAPDGLRDLMQILGFPTTNLGVVSTFFLFLPIYIIFVGTCWWLAKRIGARRN